MNKTKLTRGIVIVAIIFIGLTFGITYYQKRIKVENAGSVVLVGFPKGQGGLKLEIEKALKDQQYLNKGNQLLKEGKTDEAIEQFNVAFSVAKLSGEKGIAIVRLADAYEKKRDYKKALDYVNIDISQYVNDWAKSPVEERAKYLEYALQGEYDLAIKHAKNAIEIFKKSFPHMRTSTGGYQERLNDLIAAKDYILSLKKQK